jgi:hypothetical protein
MSSQNQSAKIAPTMIAETYRSRELPRRLRLMG